MIRGRVVFRVHALRRMAERGIGFDAVREVLENGVVVEDYPDDTPYPSRLVLGFVDSRPIHVVMADDEEDDVTFVVTTYEPDPDRWDDSFRTRRRT